MTQSVSPFLGLTECLLAVSMSDRMADSLVVWLSARGLLYLRDDGRMSVDLLVCLTDQPCV